MLGPAPRVDFSVEPAEETFYTNTDYTLESAKETVTTEAGLKDFLALNRRLSLFIMVINARMAEGIPLDDQTNQQLLKHHQHAAGELLAKKVYEKQHYSEGASIAKETCLQLLKMDDEGIFPSSKSTQ